MTKNELRWARAQVSALLRAIALDLAREAGVALEAALRLRGKA